ncbi:MAG: DNA double-strand break repair nuclease NurA [Candidatus Woesearchaeota archaeon]
MKAFFDIIENSNSETIDGSILLNNIIQKKEFAYKELIYNDTIASNENYFSAWIDGGNNEIFGSPAYSVQKIRIFASIWKGNKRFGKVMREAIVLITANKEIFVESEDDSMQTFFESAIPVITATQYYTKEHSLQSFVNMYRRALEVVLAKELSEKGFVDERNNTKSPLNVIVLDGSSMPHNSFEQKVLEPLQNVIGISKTSNIATKTQSVAHILEKIAQYEMWLCDAFEKNEYKLSFVRLHKKSVSALRIDYKKTTDLETIGALHILTELSKDPTFYGYPYPLLIADQEARVSNEEVSYAKTKILMKAKEKGLFIEQEHQRKSTHDILDAIRF